MSSQPEMVGEMRMVDNKPVLFLREGTTRQKGPSVRESTIEVGRELSAILRTTLGPKGMDKMLVQGGGEYVVTNDGATILREMKLDHPAAKMLAEAAMSQEREVGDGTKTVVILAGRLLSEMGDTLDDVHPKLVERGYRLAADKAIEAMTSMARNVPTTDTDLLRSIAGTALASKVAAPHHDLLCRLASEAVEAIAERASDGTVTSVDLANVETLKKPGGGVADSTLVKGIVLAKPRAQERMPSRVSPARVALVEDAIEPQKTERASHVRITQAARVSSFAQEEERLVLARASRLIDTGANVIFCAKGIAPAAQEAFARAGVYAVQSVDRKHIEALARATGARVAESEDITREELGVADVVEARRMEEDELTFVLAGKGARSVTLLVRGASPHVMDEVGRTLDDAMGTLRDVLLDARVVPGAGAPEVEAALAIRRYAASVSGREQLAVEAYSRALECIPRSLAENAGKNAIDVLAELRSAHDRGERSAGFDTRDGKVVDAWERGIVEPLRVDVAAVQAATGVACMLLRIDDVIMSRRDGKK